MNLYPTCRVQSYAELTPQRLRAMGAQALVCDIDNTLTAHGTGTADERLMQWVASLREAGIPLAVVSNNDARRVESFNARLGLPFLAKAGKPRRESFWKACRLLGCEPSRTAFLGDQLFTDMAGANRAGLISVLTVPLPFPEPFFVRLKRLAEMPFLRAWSRKEEKSI